MEGCDDIEADAVLFATGRMPNVEGLGLEEAGRRAGRASGEIKVDDDSRTSVPSIFAVGDVTDRIQLTPVAIREGHAFADSAVRRQAVDGRLRLRAPRRLLAIRRSPASA